MELQELTKWQMRRIYIFCMRRDFPRSELKPLKMILKGMKQGNYRCLGLKENKKLLGYAVFVQTGRDYLFDYLAVLKKARNRGAGAQFIKLLRTYFKDADSIIGEVENPDFAQTGEERELQKRRMGFYLRNGFADTGVLVKLFGVDFRIISMNPAKGLSRDEIIAIYRKHYQSILPPQLYDENVRILSERN